MKTVTTAALGMFGVLTGLAASPAIAADDTEIAHKGTLKFSTEDGTYKFQAGGRIQVDGAFYSEDNVDLDGENGTEFRRARLFIAGTMFKDWAWKAQYDFAGNDAEIKDAYIRYSGFEPGRIVIGQYKQPFSLEELTSSKYITFMERALPNAFATGRRIGLGVDHNRDKYTLMASVYGQEEGSDDGDGDEGYGFGARATFAPWKDEGKLLHFGASGAWEQPEDDEEETVRFRARPESHKTSTRLVNTGQIQGVDDIVKYGVEAATVWGPFSAQGEYIMTTVNSDVTSSDPDFSGYYVFASYFLTGESRPYKHGKFGRVKPKGKRGAWEVALRYSSIDLEDGDIEGGEEDNITVGVNWYANKYVRFMANYVRADADPFTQEASLDVSPSEDDDTLDIFQVRAQIDF